MKGTKYYGNCVSWDSDDTNSLVEMIRHAAKVENKSIIINMNKEKLHYLNNNFEFSIYLDKDVEYEKDRALLFYMTEQKHRRVYHFRIMETKSSFDQ